MESSNPLEGMAPVVDVLSNNRCLTENQTRRLEKILENYEDNIAVPASAYFVLIVAYSILIAIGTGGNLMVLTAVATNKCKSTLLSIIVTHGWDRGVWKNYLVKVQLICFTPAANFCQS